MKVPAGGTCSLTRGSRAAATLQVVATGAHTADTGHGLLREAYPDTDGRRETRATSLPGGEGTRPRETVARSAFARAVVTRIKYWKNSANPYYEL